MTHLMMPLFDNESIPPFKLKSHLVGDSNGIFKIAEGYFGKATKSECRWDNPERGPFTVHEWMKDWWLLIAHHMGEETIGIEFRWGNRLLEYEHEQVNIQFFVHEIKKPWKDWTEDEIISSPRWILSYAEENNQVSEKMHNAMVIFSYQDLESEDIKKYFDARPLIRDEPFQTITQIHKE